VAERLHVQGDYESDYSLRADNTVSDPIACKRQAYLAYKFLPVGYSYASTLVLGKRISK
jgi:hypothetical protein